MTPATFTKVMQKVFEEISGASHYFDDVLIASDKWEEHLATLREVFGKIQRAGLTVKPTKCEIGFREIACLGHRIGQGEVAPVHYILKKIRDAQRPKTNRQVTSFLWLTVYYRGLSPNYATIANPMSDLTKKGTPYNPLVRGTEGIHGNQKETCNPTDSEAAKPLLSVCAIHRRA